MKLNNAKLINKLNELADKYNHIRIMRKDLKPYIVNNYSKNSTLTLVKP